MDPLELGLVYKAIRSHLSNCYEWRDDTVIARVRSEPSLQGLDPNYIKERLYQYVAQEGGQIDQRRETRPGWRDRRRYWYRVVIPEPDFPRGIFVEIIMKDWDEDCPEVSLVNAHSQLS